MRQVSIVAAAVLILISVPCHGDSSDSLTDTESSDAETPDIPPETGVLPRRTSDDSITYNVGDSIYVSLEDIALYPLNHQESTEDQQGSNYNAYHIPSTVNFHDIYSNSLALLAEDTFGSTAKTEVTQPHKEAETTITPKDDESFHLNNINTRFVEFHPKTQTIPPRTTPPPMFALKVTNEKELENKTTTTTTTTTEEPEDLIEVIPLRKENYQRGLLDLLFPAARVRTFKSVFDTFKRMMSHTFR